MDIEQISRHPKYRISTSAAIAQIPCHWKEFKVCVQGSREKMFNVVWPGEKSLSSKRVSKLDLDYISFIVDMEFFGEQGEMIIPVPPKEEIERIKFFYDQLQSKFDGSVEYLNKEIQLLMQEMIDSQGGDARTTSDMIGRLGDSCRVTLESFQVVTDALITGELSVADNELKRTESVVNNAHLFLEGDVPESYAGSTTIQ